MFEQRRDGVADCGLTAVAHVQRAGRIRRDELDHHLALAAAQILPPAFASLEDFGHDGGDGIAGEEEIDEAGAGNLHLRHSRTRGQVRHQHFGELARGQAQRLGAGHGEVAGEVAVALVLGGVDHRRDGGSVLAKAGAGGGEGLRQQVLQVRFHRESQ